MSGITAQQYLRHSYGLNVVRHGDQSTGFRVDVLKEGQVVQTHKGDALGSAAFYIFSVIWSRFLELFRSEMLYPKFAVNSASAFISGFRVDQVLAGFNRTVFEKEILPRLHSSEDNTLRRHAEVYDKIKVMPQSKSKMYQLFDCLNRLFVYLRGHNFNIDFINWSRLHPVPIEQALGKLTDYDSFILDVDTYNGLLHKVFPGGRLETNFEGVKIFIVDPNFDILSVIGGQKVDVDVKDEWFTKSELVEVDERPAPVTKRTIHSMSHLAGTLDDDLLESHSQKIVDILSITQQSWDEETKEYISLPDKTDLIGQGGIGRNALKGITQGLCGLPVKEVLRQLTAKIRAKSGMPPDKAMHVAAVTMAKMQSARKVVYYGDTPHFVDREGSA